MRESRNAYLISAYTQWLKELNEFAPSLMSNSFSNPYFSSIPADWFNTDRPRILVVGEEGFGTWGCGNGDQSIAPHEIEKIQSLNYNYLQKQLFDLPHGEINNSAFWKRFRKISQYGICAWTNIDKIHVLHEKTCVLTESDRTLLHSLNTKLLAAEIQILEPTHVIFFGWHGTSLKHELPALYNILYPKGAKDSSVWCKNVVSVCQDSKTFIFCYHPNWGYRTKGYEDKVLSTFEDSLNRSL